MPLRIENPPPGIERRGKGWTFHPRSSVEQGCLNGELLDGIGGVIERDTLRLALTCIADLVTIFDRAVIAESG